MENKLLRIDPYDEEAFRKEAMKISVKNLVKLAKALMPESLHYIVDLYTDKNQKDYKKHALICILNSFVIKGEDCYLCRYQEYLASPKCLKCRLYYSKMKVNFEIRKVKE